MGSSRPRQILYSLCKSALFAEPLGVWPSGCICLVDGVHQYSHRLDSSDTFVWLFWVFLSEKGDLSLFNNQIQQTQSKHWCPPAVIKMRTNITPEWHRILFGIVYTCKNLHSDSCFAPERFCFCEIYFWIAQFRLSCRSLTWWIIVTEMIKEVEPAVSLKNARFLYRRALYSLLFFSFVGRNNRIFSGGKMTRALIL